MIFRQLFDLKSSTYTYLLADEVSKEAVIIDPVIDNLQHYLTLLDNLGLTLRYALDTHVHADHITALGKLREETGCITMMGEQSVAHCVSEKFVDEQLIQVGSITIRALYTPGHTDDSYCFYVPDFHGVFTGDTLLIRGTGRTDFQNGDSADQYDSLFSKLLKLPGSTKVFPGHDYKGWTQSSIAEEKQFNPRLQVNSVEEYQTLMANLNLPNPAQMDVAVPANQKCGVV